MKYKKEAFTLIEVLLGLSIFSILIVSLYSIFSSGIKINERSENENKVYQEARLSLDLMAKDLENMLPFDFSNSYPEKSSFIGNKHRIEFLLGSPQGLKWISYYLVRPQETKIHEIIIGQRHKKNVEINTGEGQGFPIYYLVREERDFTDYLGDVSSGNNKEGQEVLITSVMKEDGLRYYFGYTKDQDNEKQEESFYWKDLWDQKYNPSMIRIEIELGMRGRKKMKAVNFQKDVLSPTGFLGV